MEPALLNILEKALVWHYWNSTIRTTTASITAQERSKEQLHAAIRKYWKPAHGERLKPHLHEVINNLRSEATQVPFTSTLSHNEFMGELVDKLSKL